MYNSLRITYNLSYLHVTELKSTSTTRSKYPDISLNTFLLSFLYKNKLERNLAEMTVS